MSWNLSGTTAQAGDLASLVGLNHKHFIIKLVPGAEFQSHRGVIQHDQIIGLTWGSKIYSHNHSPFIILQPALADLLRQIKRNTQIIYPKDIGYIMVRLGIGPGTKVLEAGTGSGALTTAFAFAVGKEGRVFTYESREDMMNLARKILKKWTWKIGWNSNYMISVTVSSRQELMRHFWMFKTLMISCRKFDLL